MLMGPRSLKLEDFVSLTIFCTEPAFDFFVKTTMPLLLK